MRYFLLSIVFLGLSNWSAGQDVNEVLKKLKAKYSAVERIEYETRYELFRGHKTNEVHSAYTGYVYRHKNLMYQKIHETEFVYGSDYSLRIHSEENAMVLGLKQSSLDLEVNLDEFLKQCKSKSIKEYYSYYSVVLTFMDDSPIPLGLIKMRVNKSDFTLLQLDFYYSDFQDFSTDFRKVDLQPSHLRIKFKNINLSPEKKDYFFQYSRYIKTTKGILTPASKYKDFQLTDARI